jgi:hypothetical protein
MKSRVEILRERERLAAWFIVRRIFGDPPAEKRLNRSLLPAASKVERNESGDVEIEIPVSDEVYAYLMREYGSG